jgi:hypothetical protein
MNQSKKLQRQKGISPRVEPAAYLGEGQITRQMGHTATAALKQLGTSTNFEVLIPIRLQFLTDSAFFFDKFFFPKKKVVFFFL